MASFVDRLITFDAGFLACRLETICLCKTNRRLGKVKYITPMVMNAVENRIPKIIVLPKKLHEYTSTTIAIFEKTQINVTIE